MIVNVELNSHSPYRMELKQLFDATVAPKEGEANI